MRFTTSRMLAAAWCCLAACPLVVADTGSPPPPVIVPGGQVSITKVQFRAFWEQVLPAYEAWLPPGAACNCYPAFVTFLATIPVSDRDRAAYTQLYLQLYPLIPQTVE